MLCISRSNTFRITFQRSLSVWKSSSSLFSTKSDDKEIESGHQTGGMPQLSNEDRKFVDKFQKHQKGAARLSNAEEVRSLIEYSNGYGVLSTNSKQYGGYPTGSVVSFALDDEGYPFMAFSSMSAHTHDVDKDGKVSLTVMAKDFKGAAEGRVVLIGDIDKLELEKTQKYRDIYLKKHPDAFWVDFGDFTWYKLKELKSVRYIGGFARAGSLSPEEYLAARPDAISAFAAPVMNHMNDDHSDSTVAIVKNVVGVPVKDAEIVGLDSLGMTVKCTMDFAGGGVTKVRIPFDERVEDRKGIKSALVSMTQAATKAQADREGRD